MPNITLVRSELFESIGRHFTDEQFDELCFEFGVEVDDVATQIIEYTGDGTKEEHVVYVIAIPANRYDLLCLEGFARAIRIFLNMQANPVSYSFSHRFIQFSQVDLPRRISVGSTQIRGSK
jgi:phenylalanyl-tRNA synthetase beta chain